MAFDTAAMDVATVGPGITLLSGDCRSVLPTLAANSVQCVVTSPPYYGLRDYGTAQWDGGDAECDHAPDKRGSRFATPVSSKQASNAGSGSASQRDCRCGARRIDAQIGLEATPDEFIAQMVAVFREVRRVLRDDGTLWLNMGDSYAASMTNDRRMYQPTRSGGVSTQREPQIPQRCTASNGYKPKDLMMMPARVALALQADGWFLRSAIVWAKPNPMPESVTDRPTSAYEMVYLLTKRSRYYFDADAVREDADPAYASRYNSAFNVGAGRPGGYSNTPGMKEFTGTRNCRNVWTIATSPFSEAHFATFPPELAERCIKAGTSERGCCAACGAPWVRVTEETAEYAAVKARLRATLGPNFHMKRAGVDAVKGAGTGGNPATLPPKNTTTGWRASCKCDAPTVPCTILDPFAGAGTALLVADRLQRNAIGIELNTAYTTMAMERCRADAPLLAADRLFSSWPPAEDPADQRMAADAMQRDLFGC